MPAVRRLHHVTLTVTDVDRSVTWYARVLGLERLADRAGDGWIRTLLHNTDGVVVGLTRHEATRADAAFDHTAVGLDHVAVACADRHEVEDWAVHLETVGVAHQGVVDAPAGHVLVCRDPDGIPVEFFAPRDG